MSLLDNATLERSGVVANCRMNRERCLTGTNGYERELGFLPLDELRRRSVAGRKCVWLDLCCGTGRALIEAARRIEESEFAGRCDIVGVDLVGMFAPVGNVAGLRLVEASLSSWRPDGPCDLITCVHGLHYIGDKLGLLARAASWLTEQGLLVAHLDLANVRFEGVTTSPRIAASELRRQGFRYNSRTRRVVREGRDEVRFGVRYLGADDSAGPNYTHQPAVNSHYARIER